MKRHLKLIALFLRTTLQTQLEYRSGVYGRMVSVALSCSTSVLLIWAMFTQVDSIGGWNFHQVLVLVGVSMTIEAIVEFWMYPSLHPISTYVRRGDFDGLLLKPVGSQFMVSFRHLQIWEMSGIVIGLGVIALGMHLGNTITLPNLLLLSVFLVSAVIIIYSLFLSLSTLAFWFTRIEEVASLIWLHSSAGNFPVTGYPPWARFLFTFILPVAFVTNVPAKAATGQLTWDWALGTFVVAVVSFCASRLLWRVAIRNYSGASG